MGYEMNFLGLEGIISDTDAQAVGKQLAEKSNAYFSALAPAELATILAQYDSESRQKVISAYIASKGNATALDTALRSQPGRELYAPSSTTTIWGALAIASSAACAYHGYKRNNGSLGWALGWGFVGALFPIFSPVIAVAQGFGQPLPKMVPATW